MLRLVRRLIPRPVRTALVQAGRAASWAASRHFGPPRWRQSRIAAHPYIAQHAGVPPVSDCVPYRLEADPLGGELAGFRLVGQNWTEPSAASKPIALMVGFNSWKLGFMAQYLPEYRCAFLPGELPPPLGRAVAEATRKTLFDTVMSWGMSAPDWLDGFAGGRSIEHVRVEDGFLRSAVLGSYRSCPQSLVFDRQGIHYVHQQASELETLLGTFDIDSQPGLREAAHRALTAIRSQRLTKYALPDPDPMPRLLKDRPRPQILVPGQVTGDMSVRYGNPAQVDVRQMLECALDENPGADIWFKPHPDMLAIGAGGVHTFTGSHERVHLLGPQADMAGVLEAVDAVYTLTSLTGMEALIRGKAVKVFGTPFYAGWGLTDDRACLRRRPRQLDLISLFAISYLVYPRYLGAPLNSEVGIFRAIDTISSDRATAA